MVSKSMLNSLFQKQLTYELEPHPSYTFRDGAWVSSKHGAPSQYSSAVKHPAIERLCVITWNIDFMTSQPRARMASALRYLEQLVCKIPRSSAIVINLQEMMESNNSNKMDANDLSQIKNARWIQSHFNLTDVDTSSWDAAYGQLTLVDRRLAIASVARLRFVSEYLRSALFVDICLNTKESSYLRLGNVHLDSSYGSMRPVQWKALAKHLQNEHEDIGASILAGDCNANQPRDRTAPQDLGFKDAYLEMGGVEGDESGATWGFQSLHAQRWGHQRLDKEVFWGDVQVTALERIGIGLKVEDEKAREELEAEEELGFVTDHFGLKGEYTVEAGLMGVLE
ncbi:hypothetical protein BKA66DRAFT_473435 [Pyrenochaeta sp. MPI-SDFR-AT-0127]|nr:hypothetical protein BKA66DRAFT_473435 [Pyrenochaeta sp. MPI-SDFR-AT-0127]